MGQTLKSNLERIDRRKLMFMNPPPLPRKICLLLSCSYKQVYDNNIQMCFSKLTGPIKADYNVDAFREGTTHGEKQKPSKPNGLYSLNDMALQVLILHGLY